MRRLINKIREGSVAVNIIMLTVAGIINAFGITVFLSPVKLFDSGISGTSMFLSSVTPECMSLSIFLVVLNVPLFLYGLKKQGKAFTLYAIYTVFVYSVAAFIIQNFILVPSATSSPIGGDDLILCSVFGGIISGVGSGLAIRFGGAMDGIEVLAVIFAKKLTLTVGNFVMIYNCILYVICGIVLKSWMLPLYSVITYAAGLQAVDFIVEGIDRSKAAMIITSKSDKVCAALSEEFSRGMTVIPAKGYYSDANKTAVYFIVNRFQVGRMKSIVHKIDKDAYITISEVANVFRSQKD
ncbi:MAG: YitT family protein [Clostridia bacterium]|nr:YitT family protein [Clostridia bacterium]